MQVTLINFPTTLVAKLQHRGDPVLLNDSIASFIAWRQQTGLSPVHQSQTYGIAWDDPTTTPPAAFRFDLCGTVSAPIPENNFGVINGEISGGRYAVVRHHGSHDTLSTTVGALLREWLPESGETLRDAPLFFHYLNVGPEVAQDALLTDIYLPLDARSRQG